MSIPKHADLELVRIVVSSSKESNISFDIYHRRR